MLAWFYVSFNPTLIIKVLPVKSHVIQNKSVVRNLTTPLFLNHNRKDKKTYICTCFSISKSSLMRGNTPLNLQHFYTSQVFFLLFFKMQFSEFRESAEKIHTCWDLPVLNERPHIMYFPADYKIMIKYKMIKNKIYNYFMLFKNSFWVKIKCLVRPTNVTNELLISY